jgi:hypothetical protein
MPTTLRTYRCRLQWLLVTNSAYQELERQLVKIFISWSKDRSRKVAEALRDWLPDVIQAAEPFLSTHDIPKGVRWGHDLAKELEGTNVGIICLTPENLAERWILFEAGALSKIADRARICTYLYDLTPTQLLSPLADFQATKAVKEDTFEMLASINEALGVQRLPPEKLQRAFSRWWEALEEQLKAVPTSTEPAKTPTQEEILGEIYRYIRRSEPRIQAERDAVIESLKRCQQEYDMVAADLAMCERELDKPRADAGRDDLEVHEARKAVARAEVERLRQQMAVLQHRLASISGSLPRFAV